MIVINEEVEGGGRVWDEEQNASVLHLQVGEIKTLGCAHKRRGTASNYESGY